MTASTQRTKVVLVSGFWRSGSTVLTRALGELDGAFAAGGLETIWEYAYLGNGRCGCGRAFRECDVWQRISDEAFGGVDAVDAAWMERQQPRMRHLALMLLPGGRALLRRRFAGYIDTLDRLYRAIGSVTGCQMIIDSSKPPPYAWVLALVPSIELYNVHLVRNPLGVQYSIIRRKHRGDPRFQSHSITKSTLMWDAVNVSQELVGRQQRGRYLRVRYEDFVAAPEQTITAIQRLIGETEAGMPAIVDGAIQLGVSHTANGSENRTETGSIPFRLDRAWETDMNPRDRSLVQRITAPLLRRYGYA